MTDFDRDRYLVQLAGRRLNLCAELGGSKDIESSKFKAVVSGDPVTAREIYQRAATFRPRAMHVFATNELPTFDHGMPHSVSRRLLVIPFTRLIPHAERVIDLGRRVASEHADALVYYAVRGAMRLVRRGAFSVPPSSRAALATWMQDSDPVQAFLADDWVEHAPGQLVPSRDLYDHFVAWARAQRIERPPSIKVLVQRLVASGRGFGRTKTKSQRYITSIRLVGYTGSSGSGSAKR